MFLFSTQGARALRSGGREGTLREINTARPEESNKILTEKPTRHRRVRSAPTGEFDGVPNKCDKSHLLTAICVPPEELKAEGGPVDTELDMRGPLPGGPYCECQDVVRHQRERLGQKVEFRAGCVLELRRMRVWRRPRDTA